MRLIAALLLVAATASAQQPIPIPLFPPDNWWNTDISRAPVDPGSGSYMNYIGASRGMHPDFGGDSGDPENPIYGMPYVIVHASQPLVPVSFDYADESDAGAPGHPPGYPIPEAAKTQPKMIEGGTPGSDPPNDRDRHLLLVDVDNKIDYELYQVWWNGSQWTAGSGAVFPLDQNRRRPDGWTSADAAGLAILPGLVRWEEANGPAPIAHAFRVTVRATNGYVFPASHTAGSTRGALPMGARLRLKSSVDLSRFAPEVQRILQAMKTYGLIVADNGTDMYVTGTYDTRWNNDVLNPAFASIHASDFEVIQLGWQPPPAAKHRAARH